MEHGNKKIKNLKYVSTSLSVLVILFGLSVIIGLIENIEFLYRYEPDSVAMVYNTALSFTMLGIVMLACIHKHYYLAGMLLLLVAINAVLIITQHLFSINIGIDELIFKHRDVYSNAFSGRMAPNTALCLLLACLAIIFLNHPYNSKIFIAIGCTFSMLVLTLGSVFYAGYINSIFDTFFWGTETPMSKAAAVGFVLLGWALLSISFYHSVLKSINLIRYIPVALTICVSTATLMLVNEIYEELVIKQVSLSIVMVTLTFGILLALMCGLFLHFWILSIEIRDRLSHSQSILQGTLDCVIEGIVVVSLDGNIAAHNIRFLEMWEIPQDNQSIMDRRMLTKLIANKLCNREQYYLKRRQLALNLSYEGNDLLELSSGRIYERHIMPHIINDKIEGRVFSYRDVTSQKRLEIELLHQSTYDSLTGLPNRSLMLDLVRRAINYPGSKIHNVAIFLMDIDKFSVINDLFGRSKGDLILKMVASKIQQQLNDNCVLCRIGSDQFLVLHNNLNTPDIAVALVRKVILAFEQPLELQGNKVPITICTGITLYPKDGQTVDELLANADIAMLRAKIKGRSSFQFYTRSMNEYTLKHIEMETLLRKALIERNFVVYYQPIFDLTTQKTIGVEALVRLNDDLGALIAPHEFIPLAENLGLISKLGEMVLSESCKQAKAWHDAGFKDLLLSVNISAHQFKYGAISTVTHNVIKLSGIDPHKLELELTEGVLLGSSEEVVDAINQISNLGVRFSIDDFGTGFSSFNYVRRFAIHKIKIDQSFVRDAVNNKQDRIIVGAMIAMGKCLKFTMLAEGIETPEQQQLMKELGCTQGQGFLYAKPMSAEDCTKFLKLST